MSKQKTDLIQGTLDMLILKTLSLEPMHGLGISRRIEQLTRGVFQVQAGSLFPALHRLEQEGWLAGEWGESTKNRKAKYYRLTSAGRRQLGSERRNWTKASVAISQVLGAE
ncbi:PadR family transcriptional regulator [Gemmatimonadota bacterium]